MDKKRMCVDRIRFYHTLHKTPIKREKKGHFLTKEEIRLRIQRGRRIHRKELEPPPRYNYCAGDHLIKEWFLIAEKSYLESYVQMRSWSILKRSILIKEIKILDYKWVYIYEFDKYGRFIKCKERFVVRGN